MNIRTGIILAALIMTGQAAWSQTAEEHEMPDAYPHVVISNGIVEASVFTPDPDRGFYRSSRYDWSGMIWQLTCNGHTYYRIHRGRLPHDPSDPGHGMSTAEEFGIGHEEIPFPQRYDVAQPGETFFKMGSGTLVKPENDDRYNFGSPYEIADHGRWTTTHGRNWVEFTHILADEHGYGYTYTKRMELPPDSPELVVLHRMDNTGTEHIHMDQYCHNFFQIDNEFVGDQYELQVFFPVTINRDLGEKARLDGTTFKITQDKLQGSVWAELFDMTGTVADNRCLVTNKNTGAAVGVTGDFPLSRFVVFGTSDVLCPEMFVLLDIAPGESQEWTRTCRFITE